jgi:hypothetical protein
MFCNEQQGITLGDIIIKIFNEAMSGRSWAQAKLVPGTRLRFLCFRNLSQVLKQNREEFDSDASGRRRNLVSTHARRHRGQGAAMTTPDRRYAHRYGLKVPLVFCTVHSLLKNGHLAKSLNISSRGVYFVTRHPVFVGLPVHVLLRMPKRIAGTQATERVFTGRISHVESHDDPNESSGVGVEFFYWETHETGRGRSLNHRPK